MEYDVKLQHRKGKTMVVADALSRRADHAKGIEIKETITALPDNLWIQLLDQELQDAVAKLQTTDTTAQEVTSELSKHILSSDDWTIEDGPNGTKILFHKNHMYIPDDITLRRKIVSDHHDTSVTGHPSILGTLRAIRMAYFWPGMQQFVRNYVNGCAVCQQFKVSTHPTKPQLFPIPSGSPRLFGSIGIDFMTDLPLSADGYDSIMVTVDHGSSKGVILTKTSKTGLTAEHTAQLFIDDVYSRFGLPDKIMTDQGTQFNSDFFKDLCHKLDIKPSMTTAFHPQANGGTERVN